MHIIAQSVHPDEACWGLAERAINGRWVQQVFVNRGDAIAKHETDYGPAEDFAQVVPLVMPGLGIETVGRLRDFADRHRQDSYWMKRRHEMLAGSTLVQDVLRQEEEKLAFKMNKTVSGPFVRVERNGYPRQAAERRIVERVHGR